MNYTFEDWVQFREARKLTNKDVAAIIGTGVENVKRQIGPTKKKLPAWARGMIHEWKTCAINVNCEEIITNEAVPEIKPITAPKTCDCYMDGTILRRGKSGCKMAKNEHKW